MADSFGGVPQLILPAGEEKADPLHAIARRLFPLVRSDPEWWREAIRRWASDPPRHHVESPTIKTVELIEDVRRDSVERARRGKNESDANWKRRRAAIKRSRDRAKQRLTKLESLPDGAELHDERECRWLPVPFPESLTPDERVAILAAIHDAYTTDVARIDPWPSRELPPLESADGIRERQLAIRYRILVSDRVPKLRQDWDTHEAAIELFMSEAANAIEVYSTGGIGPMVDELSERRFNPDISDAIADADRSAFRPKAVAPKKAKRSTQKGEGEAKLIAALTKHHKYADGSCLNLEPIGNNESARRAQVEESTASNFFKKHFKGYAKYKILCRDPGRLAAALKLLNGEFSPHDLYGAKPPGEDERDDE